MGHCKSELALTRFGLGATLPTGWRFWRSPTLTPRQGHRGPGQWVPGSSGLQGGASPALTPAPEPGGPQVGQNEALPHTAPLPTGSAPSLLPKFLADSLGGPRRRLDPRGWQEPQAREGDVRPDQADAALGPRRPAGLRDSCSGRGRGAGRGPRGRRVRAAGPLARVGGSVQRRGGGGRGRGAEGVRVFKRHGLAGSCCCCCWRTDPEGDLAGKGSRARGALSGEPGGRGSRMRRAHGS